MVQTYVQTERRFYPEKELRVWKPEGRRKTNGKIRLLETCWEVLETGDRGRK